MALQVRELREEGDALPAIHDSSHRLPLLLIWEVYQVPKALKQTLT